MYISTCENWHLKPNYTCKIPLMMTILLQPKHVALFLMNVCCADWLNTIFNVLNTQRDEHAQNKRLCLR